MKLIKHGIEITKKESFLVWVFAVPKLASLIAAYFQNTCFVGSKVLMNGGVIVRGNLKGFSRVIFSLFFRCFGALIF
jgi:hypothetical protein